VFWITLLLLSINWVAPQAVQWLALPLLIGGLIFPGIPHGAVDHVLDGSAPSSPRQWVKFIALYVSIMIAIVAVWWASPTIGLIAFLAYSAWHFGETDLKHWGIYTPVMASVYGVSLLGFILGTHPTALSQYVNALGLPLINFSDFTPVLAVFVVGLIGPVFRVPRKALPSYFLTLSVIALGTMLPLLLTFALYFVGLHSWRAWRHLRSGLKYSDRKLIRAAAPFSIAAYAFIAAFALALYTMDLPFEGLPSAIFLFLAAVSAPHIWMMHGFYGK
jgi:Brp/Blh family beta-carotene 15,15'-monooxygenase